MARRGPASVDRWRATRGHFRNFQHFCGKTSKKIEWGPFEVNKSFQKSQCRKKTIAIHQKNEVDPLVKNFFRKKVCREKLEGGTFWSRPVLYVTMKKKTEQLFWLSSFDQMVQFDTSKYRRTCKNYFGQFVWIEKSQ